MKDYIRTEIPDCGFDRFRGFQMDLLVSNSHAALIVSVDVKFDIFGVAVEIACGPNHIIFFFGSAVQSEEFAKQRLPNEARSSGNKNLNINTPYS